MNIIFTGESALVIIGFIAPAITNLKSNASKMLVAALAIVYISSVGAALLSSIAGLISKMNPIEVFKHYGPAYLTAVGTMSSAATLPVALSCARNTL